jgi:hypothetical protein
MREFDLPYSLPSLEPRKIVPGGEKGFRRWLIGLTPSRRSRPRRRVEHYWLCDQCSSVLTLIFEKEHGMLTVPLPDANKRALIAQTGAA